MNTQFAFITFIITAIFTPLALISAVVKLLMHFRSETVTGEIVYKHIYSSRGGRSYVVNYRFSTQPSASAEAKTITKSTSVTRSHYDTIEVNTEALVRYLVDYPSISKLVGIESDTYVYLLLGIALLSLFLCISTTFIALSA